MSAEGAVFARSWSVGKYMAELTLPRAKPGAALQARIEWSPCVPTKLTAVELEQYRAGRNVALSELARDQGIALCLVDL